MKLERFPYTGLFKGKKLVSNTIIQGALGDFLGSGSFTVLSMALQYCSHESLQYCSHESPGALEHLQCW